MITCLLRRKISALIKTNETELQRHNDEKSGITKIQTPLCSLAEKFCQIKRRRHTINISCHVYIHCKLMHRN